MYRKTYAGFILWLAGLIAAMAAALLFGSGDVALFMRLLQNLCTGSLALLSRMVWRSECVYWYNGVSYEEAEKAGSERRRAYAWKHFRLLGLYALAALLLTLSASLIGLSFWIDFLLITLGLMAAALWTLRYKL